MKNFDIYLCGGMGKFGKENYGEGNIWREYCKDRLEANSSRYYVRAINPNDYFNFRDDPPKYENHSEVMRLDLCKLRGCDLVIVNFNDPTSLGSMAEMGIAYDRQIPIIGLNESFYDLHPWQEAMCERIFNDIDDMIVYIASFYLR